MAIEIERKFLVKSDAYKQFAYTSYRIKQGYICAESGKTVRVRLADDKAFLTIKGKSGDGGLSRCEWEYEIPAGDAEELFALCEPPLIDKTRFLVEVGEGQVFEIDEFYGDNEGLVLAEIELESIDEQVVIPDFIGCEVTGDKRFYNSHLQKYPYKYWENYSNNT